MNMHASTLQPEDYAEPACPLCEKTYGTTPAVRPIPLSRVAERLNRCLNRRDSAGAERHMLYWLNEAVLGRDRRGELFLCNELSGHYRKASDREQAFRYADRALELAEEMGVEMTETGAVTLVNAATVCAAFDANERALALFGRAQAVCDALPACPPRLRSSLYNNMAAACKSLARYDEAASLYARAMELLREEVPGSQLEQAITCLNLADTASEKQGLEAAEARVTELLGRAWELLQDPSVQRDGYYAFVCEKCAPSFSYYGWFAAARELREAARCATEKPGAAE